MIFVARTLLVISVALNLLLSQRLLWRTDTGVAREAEGKPQTPAAIGNKADEPLPALVERAIARAKVEEKFSQQRLALLKTQPETPFWRPEYQQPTLSAMDNLMGDFESLSKSESDALRKIGPPEPTDFKLREVLSLDSGVGDLSQPQRLAYYQSMKDRLFQARSVHAGSDGVERERQIKEAYALVAQDLKGILTEDQLAEIKLRTPGPLRLELAKFLMSEDEFRKIVAVAGQAQSMKEIDQEKLRIALGDQRYEQLRFSLDPANEFFVRLANRVNLPIEKAVEAKELIRSSYREWDAARRAPPGNRATRDRADALREQAAQQIRALLGEEGYKIYEQGLGGWLKKQ